MRETRSNITNEIDKRKNLKRREMRSMCVRLSLGFFLCPSLFLTISFYNRSISDFSQLPRNLQLFKSIRTRQHGLGFFRTVRVIQAQSKCWTEIGSNTYDKERFANQRKNLTHFSHMNLYQMFLSLFLETRWTFSMLHHKMSCVII